MLLFQERVREQPKEIRKREKRREEEEEEEEEARISRGSSSTLEHWKGYP